MTNHLFSTGTARGGTGLVAHMLSAHPKIKIASDPLLGLYKLFRNEVISAAGDFTFESFDPTDPFGDNYFTVERRQMLDLLLNADLGSALPKSALKSLHLSLKNRAKLASADLVPQIENSIRGETFKEAFANALAMVSRARSPEDPLDWVGIHENWTIDFFIPLARAFPNAKFYVVIRDPRAVFSSNSREQDKSLVGHIVSYARCHRKLMACASHYQTLPLFKDRLLVVKYEDLVEDPETNCYRMCQFLNVNYDPIMLDTKRYLNHATGGVHDGLSNYEKNAQGFNPIRINRWREYLTEERIDLIDFLCGPEMSLWGYKTDRVGLYDDAPIECCESMVLEMSGDKAWRTDFMDPMQDYGYELVRRQLLLEASSHLLDSCELVQRNFLFPAVFHMIKKS